MKRHMMAAMLAALLCLMSLQALADDEQPALAAGTAVTIGYAQLLDAPSVQANTLLDYYPGVRVEVTDVQDGYAAVTVGAENGCISGYMPVGLLAGGEESIRREMPMMVRMYAEHMVKTYSACDEEAERIGEVIELSSAAVLGVSDRWLHVNLDRMGYDSAFVRMEQEAYELLQSDPMSYTFTRPMEGELSFEAAIEHAKTMVLEHGKSGMGLNTEGVTRGTLDACRAAVAVHYYPAFDTKMMYEITFYKSWDMEGPDIHAWINFWVDGMEIKSFDFGNG